MAAAYHRFHWPLAGLVAPEQQDGGPARVKQGQDAQVAVLLDDQLLHLRIEGAAFDLAHYGALERRATLGQHRHALADGLLLDDVQRGPPLAELVGVLDLEHKRNIREDVYSVKRNRLRLLVVDDELAVGDGVGRDGLLEQAAGRGGGSCVGSRET